VPRPGFSLGVCFPSFEPGFSGYGGGLLSPQRLERPECLTGLHHRGKITYKPPIIKFFSYLAKTLYSKYLN